jgi:hypothetical protein
MATVEDKKHKLSVYLIKESYTDDARYFPRSVKWILMYEEMRTWLIFQSMYFELGLPKLSSSCDIASRTGSEQLTYFLFLKIPEEKR